MSARQPARHKVEMRNSNRILKIALEKSNTCLAATEKNGIYKT